MIKIHKFIDTDKYIWCRDAALIQVTEGKSALKNHRQTVIIILMT